MFNENNLFSHVQVRGGLPCFWEVNEKKKCVITKEVDLTAQAFRNHATDLTEAYARVVIIDQMKTSKKDEQSISAHV